MRLSLTISFTSLKNTSETAAIIDLAIIQDPEVDVNLFHIQGKSMICSQNFLDRLAKNTKKNRLNVVICIHCGSIGSTFMVLGEVFVKMAASFLTMHPNEAPL